MPEENENLETTPTTENGDVDYKALYEKEKELKEKRQSRFKSAKAQEREKSQYQIDDSYIDSKVKEELFFEKNSTANEFRKEVKEIQSQYEGMDVKTAYELYLAKNKPDLLAQQPSSTGVDGITKNPEPEKDPKDMSDEEFDKWWKSRK